MLPVDFKIESKTGNFIQCEKPDQSKDRKFASASNHRRRCSITISRHIPYVDLEF